MDFHPTSPLTILSFKYDPFERRIYKSSSSGTSVYAYDGDNLKSGQLLALHLPA